MDLSPRTIPILRLKISARFLGDCAARALKPTAPLACTEPLWRVTCARRETPQARQAVLTAHCWFAPFLAKRHPSTGGRPVPLPLTSPPLGLPHGRCFWVCLLVNCASL